MATKIKVVVWDFDGVLVENSETFKAQAWQQVFAEYQGTYEPFFAEAEKKYTHGKYGDRFDILRYVYRRIGFAGDGLEAQILMGAERFNQLVQAMIKRAGLTPGAGTALEQLSAKEVPMYLYSSTATMALRESAQMLGIRKYFKEMHGGPASKGESLLEIIRKEQVTPEEVLVIGDGQGDVIAAQETGVKLVGFANDWNQWQGTEQNFPLITSVKEVVKLVK